MSGDRVHGWFSQFFWDPFPGNNGPGELRGQKQRKIPGALHFPKSLNSWGTQARGKKPAGVCVPPPFGGPIPNFGGSCVPRWAFWGENTLGGPGLWGPFFPGFGRNFPPNFTTGSLTPGGLAIRGPSGISFGGTPKGRPFGCPGRCGGKKGNTRGGLGVERVYTARGTPPPGEFGPLFPQVFVGSSKPISPQCDFWGKVGVFKPFALSPGPPFFSTGGGGGGLDF